MSAEQRGPAAGNDCVEMEGRGEMIKAPINLQGLRRRLYVKAKTEPSWRFWGIYAHVCKLETLRKAYALARANNGAPGIDGMTFEAIEAQGPECFLEQIQSELIQNPAHHVLVDFHSEGVRNLLGNAGTAEAWIAALDLEDRGNQCFGRSFGAGAPAGARRKQPLIRRTSAR